jgi:hypothetical protein
MPTSYVNLSKLGRYTQHPYSGHFECNYQHLKSSASPSGRRRHFVKRTAQ